MDENIRLRRTVLHNLAAMHSNGFAGLTPEERMQWRRAGELLRAGRDAEAVALLEEMAGLRQAANDSAPDLPPAA